MAYVGRPPSNATLSSADIADGIIVAADLAPDSVGTSELADSVTLVTPNLGTPSAGVVTNLSGVLPVGVTGGSGLNASNIGITHASEWHLTSNLTGDAAPIVDNLAQIGTALGAVMTEVDGLFTFPASGIWSITTSWMFYILTSTDRSCGIGIEVSKDGGSYAEVAFGSNGISNTGSGTQFSHAGCQYIFDVIDVSDYNCRFSVDVVNTSIISYGSGTSARCSITFIRLGDT